jgi:methylated-DNA-[protein]-cysteine S-methyltransferase
LRAYESGKTLSFNLPLEPEGSDFRIDVWKLLQEIEAGERTTYGTLAKQLAADRGLEGMSAQAVGGAVGHNPIAIVIPCHRVVGAKGQLTGYAGGLERKAALLEHEKTFAPLDLKEAGQ